jgi:hypothetical protein
LYIGKNPDFSHYEGATMETFLGVLVVMLAGLTMGSGAWPMKVIRTFGFEHWFFLGNLTGLVIMPWTITLIAFPHVFEAYRDVPPSYLITSNVCALSWGVANVLCGLCLVRIGVALTMAILTGLGASVAVVLPMVLKGSGLFKDSPGIMTPAGLCVVAGVGVMLVGVILASLAGFGRDRELKKLQQPSGSFFLGLVMVVIAGITSAGIMLAFVYSNGPIISRVSLIQPGAKVEVAVTGNKELSHSYIVSQDGTITLKDVGTVQVAGISAKATADKIADLLHLAQVPERDAKVRVETANILAVFAVSAVALLGGVLINLLYPVILLCKNKSWGVFLTNWKEIFLSLMMGIQFSVAVVLAGKGMILLGALGASVGAGIQQAMQMVGGQGLGFISGEWRGVHGRPRIQMYLAIAALMLATIIMAIGNTLT